jgi:hypothetical protein
MSTKATILFDDGWHLYREVADGTIHLHLDEPGDVDFVCSQHHIDVMLPLRVLDALLDSTETVRREVAFAHEDRQAWAKHLDDVPDD